MVAVYYWLPADDNRVIESRHIGPIQRQMTEPSNWSAKVSHESNALDLDEGVFTWKDPAKIARSLKNSADTSKRRKATPFRSAMSMLVFYINRSGKHLDPQQKKILEQAKVELRRLYGRFS